MPRFRLTRGTHRRADGERAEAGEVVELTERQVEQFNMDKFEPVSDQAEEVESEIDEGREAAGDLPDDWELLQSMAVVYEGDEVRGNSSEEDIRAFFQDFSDTEIANLKEEARDRLYSEPDDADQDGSDEDEEPDEESDEDSDEDEE